ncbi:unnamed protein product [Darwinula stevensoni]|uniref:Phosphodiesterase n=1 Tax=Darwinula stevensoni TaxID=69355 RepID=A0A7R9AFB2_9CRUS|nr:unnamed protein product [Darwinula stevensoni]CAG0902241.1 unnamed protein product [Darwinula stevensoni]
MLLARLQVSIVQSMGKKHDYPRKVFSMVTISDSGTPETVTFFTSISWQKLEYGGAYAWPCISEEERSGEGLEQSGMTDKGLAGGDTGDSSFRNSLDDGSQDLKDAQNAFECARMEAWLDEHPDYVQDYLNRKGTRQMVDSWLIAHAFQQEPVGDPRVVVDSASSHNTSRPNSGAATPVRKISATEFERGGLLTPMVMTVDGCPTFLSTPIDSSNSRGILVYKMRRKSRAELQALDEKELIFELVKDICNDLDVKWLCHKILQNVSILTNADRCSLFLVQGEREGEKGLVSTLFDVCSRSTPEQMIEKEEIQVPWGVGIVGYVAKTGESVNIPDAYLDSRFNHDIDAKTGYVTRSLLCMPIKDYGGDVIGVAQVINKRDGGIFTLNDEKVFAAYLQFCGIGLRNAQLYEKSQLENKRNQAIPLCFPLSVLLDLARMVFEEQSTIEQIVYRIMTLTQSLLECQRCQVTTLKPKTSHCVFDAIESVAPLHCWQVMLLHESTKSTFSRVFDLDVTDTNGDEWESRTSPFENRFPFHIGISGHVATTGETLNIPDVYRDPRFDAAADRNTDFHTHSILSMAIKNSSHRIIGVIQLVNKIKGRSFTKNDENFLEAFAIFCGMGIHNTQMYEQAMTAIAKQEVTLEVLSYHATAPQDEVNRLERHVVPSSHFYRLYNYSFEDLELSDEDTLKACLRMFMDLDLMEHFSINYSVLCRWLLSIRKNYRHVIYHNWRHAFNVAQMMFSILVATQLWQALGDLECLALLIACLCHDLDHRGTNNSFQIKMSSPLAQLYSTSTMEHHHFDQCIMILNTPGNQILAQLRPDQYKKVVRIVEEAILATDLAVYFRNRGRFIELVESGSYDWSVDSQREQLRGMLMTACDIAAITKPWPIQKRVAELVASEFFEQGDMEKEKLKITPIDLMNREKRDDLPIMQVSFIDSICLPVYQVSRGSMLGRCDPDIALAKISDRLVPLLKGVEDNRAHWNTLAEARNAQLRKFNNGA